MPALSLEPAVIETTPPAVQPAAGVVGVGAVPDILTLPVPTFKIMPVAPVVLPIVIVLAFAPVPKLRALTVLESMVNAPEAVKLVDDPKETVPEPA